MLDFNQAYEFAQKLTIDLGTYAHEQRHNAQVVVQKDLRDICTNIDKEVEQMAVNMISQTFPGHNIHSEEMGFLDRQSEYTWFLDPIDGTKEFLQDIPLYNTCLTLETKESVLLGMIYYPVTKKLWHTSREHQAKVNQTPTQVSSISDLAKSVIYAYLPNYKLPSPQLESSWQTLASLSKSVYRIRGSVANAIDLCYVSQGIAEGLISIHAQAFQKWEDVSAGILMVESSGGKVTDRYGNPLKPQDLTNGFVATNGKIHDSLIAIINHH